VRSIEINKVLVSKSRDYKNTLHRQFSEYQKAFIEKLRGLCTSEPKLYWSLLKKGCDKSKNVVQKVALGVFVNHFKELNMVVNEVDVELPDNIPEYNYVINSDISEKEVNDAIRSLKHNKACGNDLILNEFLRNASGKLMPVFVKIFNIVFHRGIVPNSWSEGYICPIYKNKGDPNNVDNYRGITILSCYGKLFTCILRERPFNLKEGGGGYVFFKKKYSDSQCC
jgi:hypothetical protein